MNNLFTFGRFNKVIKPKATGFFSSHFGLQFLLDQKIGNLPAYTSFHMSYAIQLVKLRLLNAHIHFKISSQVGLLSYKFVWLALFVREQPGSLSHSPQKARGRFTNSENKTYCQGPQ
jgi:hypothetical protein